MLREKIISELERAYGKIVVNDGDDLDPYSYPLSHEVADQLLALKEKEEPLLGLATTRQLLDEIRARIEVDGKLDYRTVDNES